MHHHPEDENTQDKSDTSDTSSTKTLSGIPTLHGGPLSRQPLPAVSTNHYLPPSSLAKAVPKEEGPKPAPVVVASNVQMLEEQIAQLRQTIALQATAIEHATASATRMHATTKRLEAETGHHLRVLSDKEEEKRLALKQQEETFVQALLKALGGTEVLETTKASMPGQVASEQGKTDVENEGGSSPCSDASADESIKLMHIVTYLESLRHASNAAPLMRVVESNKVDPPIPPKKRNLGKGLSTAGLVLTLVGLTGSGYAVTGLMGLVAIPFIGPAVALVMAVTVLALGLVVGVMGLRKNYKKDNQNAKGAKMDRQMDEGSSHIGLPGPAFMPEAATTARPVLSARDVVVIDREAGPAEQSEERGRKNLQMAKQAEQKRFAEEQTKVVFG